MKIKPITDEKSYQAALKAVEPFFDTEPVKGSAEGDFFEVMLTLIEHYENEHFPIDLPTPIDAIKFRMEQQGLEAKDLAIAIGQTNRVYEILNGKRKLTLPMIWKLNKLFNIPVDSLIKQY
ncbi:MAG: helix-turn-helix domain-containing protein [Enterobacteriaceae bacterium]|jgi:HTH-type transcriptional regulator/antitoxin HigA|nr:helix-turn-helix domain-containing protein [Enterobacteriaceae bacterium]